MSFLFSFIGSAAKAMSPTNQLREISPGFWNVRVPFKIFKIVDIGTHMSVIKLSNDKFLVVDTVEMNDEVKKQFDELTENGSKIEAVIGTHPFHTLAFPGFHKLYPDAPFYGTPRHVRRITEIPWAGTLNNEEKCLARWAPDVQLRIPDGEFNLIFGEYGARADLINFLQVLNTSTHSQRKRIISSACLSIIQRQRLFTSMTL